MVGWVAQEQRRGWRIQLETQAVFGLRLLQATIPVRPGLGQFALERRLARAGRLLREAGCRRALTDADFPLWSKLEEIGLLPVDPGSLCMSLAPRLTLAYLERKGIPAQEATVALVGRRVDRFLFETASALCPCVRHLAIRAGEDGTELARWLEREYGVPVLERDCGAHVKLHFAPPAEQPGADELVLCGPVPGLGALDLRMATPLPEKLDPLPLLALLWEEGRLNCEDIVIFTIGQGQMT